jgi:uncharacterized protein (TIGR03435 family)
MKRLLLGAAVSVVLVAGVGRAWAQASEAKDLTGQWQGTTQGAPQPELRVVFLVSKAADGGWKTVFNYIDLIAQGTGIPRAANMTLRGSTVQIEVPANGGRYQGQLSADGTVITGSWTQGAKTMTLDLIRATTATAWEVPKPPAPPPPMAANADPSFDVATIKPSDPNARGKGFGIRGRNFSTRNTSLDDLIEYAYDVHLKQIVGGPDWMDKDRFDVSAVPDREGDPSHQQWQTMVQKLLADRFQLKFHHDKRELSVYVLSLAKGGPKNLTRSYRTDDKFSIPIGAAPGGLTMRVSNGSLRDFSGFALQGAVLDRPVLDQTGLKGRYDFVLTWSPSGTEFGGRLPPPPPSDNPPPGLFQAIQEQLGMKLDAVKAPAEVMVIDEAEKPSAN